MPKKVSPVQLKTRSACVVYSWMRAWNIPVRLPEVHSEGDLVVDDKSVVFREDGERGGFDIALSSSAILGANLNATLAELHRVTDLVGRGRPAGFRNVTGMGRASPSDYLGVSMRLTPFSRAPNIPEEDIVRWRPVLKREADRAARRYAGILFNMGLDRQDMFNIGLVFLVTYLNRHQALGDDRINGAQLTLSLHQRFGRWAAVTVKHLKSVAPITSGLPVDALVGSPCPNSVLEDSHGTDREASYTFSPESLDEPDTDEEPDFTSDEAEQKYLHSKAMKEGRYMAKRRRNAKAALDSMLEEMPHDRMVFVLAEVAESDFQHQDARDEAVRRLCDHKSSCSGCQA
jgi:hypothetical protein